MRGNTSTTWKSCTVQVFHILIQSAQLFAVSFLSGKGNKLISTLVPKDLVDGLNLLIDPNIRKRAGVAPENEFIFPSTHLSSNHSHGWHAVRDVCIAAGVSPERINATKQRARVSTLYAGQDVRQEKRQLFYSHMGHNSEVNIGTYQRPPAVDTIVHLGKVLKDIDSGLLCFFVNAICNFHVP